MTMSYPYWSVARDHGFSYADVLAAVEFMEHAPKALAYWCSFTGTHWERSDNLYWHVAQAMKAEYARRARVTE